MTSPVVEECFTCIADPAPAGTAPVNPPRDNGLFQASQVNRINTAEHWPMVGFNWETQHCAPGWVWSRPCSQLTIALDKQLVAQGMEWANAVPFTVGESVSCLRDPGSDNEAKARTRLNENVELLIERTLWQQRWGSSFAAADRVTTFDPHLQAAPGWTTPTAVDPIAGLALLEHAIRSTYSRQAVIHAPDVTASMWAYLMQIDRKAGRPFTPLGNRWAFGAGYTGDTDPLGLGPADDGEAWLVATGAVGVWIGPAISRNGLDLKTNMDLAIAEAPVAVGYECTAFAVKIRTSTGCLPCPTP